MYKRQTYEIIIKNDDELKLIGQAMQAMWKQNLGLNFTITTYESGSYWDEFYDGNFDVAFDGWTGDYDDPNTMLECFTPVSYTHLKSVLRPAPCPYSIPGSLPGQCCPRCAGNGKKSLRPEAH